MAGVGGGECEGGHPGGHHMRPLAPGSPPHVPEGWCKDGCLFSWDFVTDGSSYPARGQHFHLNGISEAWFLDDRRVFGGGRAAAAHLSLTELLRSQMRETPCAAAAQGWGEAPHQALGQPGVCLPGEMR